MAQNLSNTIAELLDLLGDTEATKDATKYEKDEYFRTTKMYRLIFAAAGGATSIIAAIIVGLVSYLKGDPTPRPDERFYKAIIYGNATAGLAGMVFTPMGAIAGGIVGRRVASKKLQRKQQPAQQTLALPSGLFRNRADKISERASSL